jgi:hypothetical protein
MPIIVERSSGRPAIVDATRILGPQLGSLVANTKSFLILSAFAAVGLAMVALALSSSASLWTDPAALSVTLS